MVEVFALVGLPVLTIILSMFLGSFVLGKSNSSKPAILLFLTCVAISIWSVGELLYLTANSPEQAIQLGKFMSVWPIVHLLIFYYVVELTKTRLWRKPVMFVGMAIPPISVLLLDLFTELYHRSPRPFAGYYIPTQEMNVVNTAGMLWIIGLDAISLAIAVFCLLRTKNELLQRHCRIIMLSFFTLFLLAPLQLLPIVFESDLQPSQGFSAVFLVAINVYGLTRYGLHIISIEDAAEVIVENMPSLVLLVEPDGSIERMNRAAGDILGYSEMQVKSLKIRNVLVSEEDALPGSSGKEAWLRTSTDEHIQFFLSSSPIFGPGNLLLGHVYIGTGISNVRKKWDKDQKIQWLEAVGRFTEGVAHELNNLFNVITANSELIDVVAPEDPTLREGLAIITQQTFSASSLIKQLLDYSQQTTTNCKPVQVFKLVEEIVEGLRQRLPPSIHFKFVNHLKDPIWVNIDSAQVLIIIQNLIDNAIDAITSGGTIEVGLRQCRTQSGKICVYVKDDGSGIPKDIQNRIFQPLFSTKKNTITPSIGLGLAQASGLAQLQGGSISFETTETEGTVFYLRLPITSPAEPKIEDLTQKTSPVRTKNVTILLADDFLELREVMVKYLRKHNYLVLPAADGREALEIFAQHKDEIDLVIVDMVMPDIDGASVFRSVKNDHPNLPVMIVSGYSNQVLASDLMAEGLDRWLQKPVSFDVLQETIKEILNLS